VLRTGLVRMAPIEPLGQKKSTSRAAMYKVIRRRELIARVNAARDQRVVADDMLTVADAAVFAGVDESRLAQWAKRGRCIALADSQEQMWLPKWQFEPPLWDALPKLIKALGTTDGWALLAFLETPLGALEGSTPRVAIERGLADKVVQLIGFDE
jgi:hypothetical protein